jgi:hypothetical protein
MSIRATLLRRSPVYDVAAKLQRAGIKAVDIRLREDDIPVGDLRRRVIRAVIVTNEDAFTVGEDRYPTLFKPGDVLNSTMRGVQRNNVLRQALQAVTVLERRGIQTLSVDRKSVDEVEQELGIVRPGIERR